MDPLDWRPQWEPLQIIRITKRSGKPSKYDLDFDGLEQLLEPFGDKPVVVIPIVGPSRLGKSFILNYMCRYLSDPKNIDWIGRSDESLNGFLWKADDDPQTWGLWLSKPFAIKQSNGEEIVVLLMDTQGVFDEWSTQRDWSTIVGISLLMSSLIIYNVFTNLQEEVLMNLESFLQYGLLASKANTGSGDGKPFQSLMFLIRDWNTPQKFKYGLKGGKGFLDKKLDIKEDQSTSAKTVRRLLYQCFQDVSCFLMPKIGDKAEEEDFNGCVDSLSPRYVEKMTEFITHLLNPEELKPKMIDNNVIKAKELVQYFKTYVQIFNSEELPKPTDIIEATAKTTDLIQINKLKESHFTQLKAFIPQKSFLAEKVLNDHNEELKTETIEVFEGLKRSDNKDIVKELFDLIESQLNSNYEHVFNDNQRRREQTIARAVEHSGQVFDDLINEKLDSKFLEPFALEEICKKFKNNGLSAFKEYFNGEDEDMFAKDILKLKKMIDSSESAIISENRRRIAEAEKNNANAVNEAIDSYRRDMKSIFDQNVFITKEEFKGFENTINIETKEYFKENCSSGDSKFKKRFELEFGQKLNESKEELKQQNRTKCDRIVVNTDKHLMSAIEEYKQKLDQMFDLIASEEDLIGRHEDVMQYCLDQFNDNCLYKNSAFLKPYLDTFDKELISSLNGLKTKVIERNERIKNLFKSRVLESKELYIQEMNNEFRNKTMFSTEELNEFNENYRIEAILHFEGLENTEITGFDSNSYLSSLEQSIDEEFDKYVHKNQSNRDFIGKDLEVITNDFLEKYESKIEEYIESVESEDQLKVKHEDVKNDIITQFKAKNPFSELSSFEPYLQKLEEKIDNSLEDSLDLLKLQLQNQESVDKNLKSDVRKYYKEEMEKYFQKTSFLSKDKLMKNNETVLKNTIQKFETERGNMSFDNYEKLITDSVKDIFGQIEAENDMNTPTLPAIGIDLGTTNSCVAYFKPERKNPYNVVVIPNELGKNTTPSVVSIRDDGEVIGNVAKDEINIHPKNTIYSSKRLIGRQFTDQSVQKAITSEPKLSYSVVDDGLDNPKINVKVNGKDETYFPEQISSKVLKKMKEIAENHLGCKVKKAVITVPAYFNDSQKEATKDAGRLAGLEVMKIINEPTAAAIAFKLHKSEEIDSRKVLIYDFGGGTFDVAVLVIHKGEVLIKAVGGDNHLGGDDFDNNIVKYCLDEFRAQTGLIVSSIDGTGAEAISRLRSVCEEQKCSLSSTNSTNISILNFYNNYDLNVTLSRDKFEDLNNDLFIRSMDLVAQTLEDANMTYSEIDDIVLVGGSTRIPRIQEMLSDQFGGRPLNHAVNPDEAVAVGAAIQAAILNGQQAQGLGHLKVSDVAPMSLGVKVVGGFMSVIISRNSKVPNTYESQYETASDYQTQVEVQVFEGEEQMADDNRLLGKFDLKGIPSAPKGEQPLKVLFEITDEGILRVNAKIVKTGGEEEIEIKEHKGRLTDQELEQMIEQGN